MRMESQGRASGAASGGARRAARDAREGEGMNTMGMKRARCRGGDEEEGGEQGSEGRHRKGDWKRRQRTGEGTSRKGWKRQLGERWEGVGLLRSLLVGHTKYLISRSCLCEKQRESSKCLCRPGKTA